MGLGPTAGSPTGSYVAARNVRLGGWQEGKGGIPQNIKGTMEIPWDMPTGTNEVMGAHYDFQHNDDQGEKGYLYWFNRNSNGNHCIVRYRDGMTQGEIIAQSPNLNFQPDNYITGISVVDRKYLQWTDYHNRPGEIEIEHSTLVDKTVEIRAYIQRSEELLAFRTFTAAIGDGTTTVVTLPNFYVANTSDVYDFNPMMRGLAAAWNASALGTYFTAEFCDTYLEFTANQVGSEWDLLINWQDTIGTVLQPVASAQSEYHNRYNFPYTEEQLARAKVAPAYPPTITLVEDRDRESNLIERRVFQFAYAYRFRDRSRSTISPISLIPVDAAQCDYAAFNRIDISFPFDEWLASTSMASLAMRGEISGVEILAREGSDNPWRSIKTLSKAEWIYREPYKWYNEGIYPTIDNDWADLLYSNVPIIAQSCEIITDNENNYRAIFGGTVEGYPNPCLDVTVTPRYLEDGIVNLGGAGVTFKVLIKAPFESPTGTSLSFLNQQPIHQPDPAGPIMYGGLGPSPFFQTSPSPDAYGQELGETGFIFYIEGTDIICITEQNVPTTTYGCGTNTPTLIPGTTVYDTSQTGEPLFSNVCQYTHRGAARNAIKASGVFSTGTITGLQPGQTYVIRMADPRCSFDNPDPEYDLNNPDRLYQKTSGYMLQLGSITSASVRPDFHECVVTIPPTGGTVDIGNVFVADLTSVGQVLNDTVVHRGYAMDFEATDNGGSIDIREGTPMERQAMHLKPFILGVPSTPPNQAGATYLAAQGLDLAEYIFNQGFCPSDHNGHFFFSYLKSTVSVFTYRVGGAAITGDPSSPSGTFTGYAAGDFTVANLQVINNFGQSKWQGNFSGTLSGPVTGNLGNASQMYEWFVPNLNQTVHDVCRTSVSGLVTTVGGTPLSNVLLVLEDGSSTRTNGQGEFSIPTYGDMFKNDVINGNNNDRITRIIINWDSACVLSITGGNIQPINITQFEENQEWSNLVDYDVDFTGQVQSNGLSYARKRGGGKLVGVALKDQYGVISRIQEVADLSFAHLTEDLNKYDPIRYPTPGTFRYGPIELDWTVNGDVPEPEFGYYKFLQFFETADTVFNFYLQWAVSSAIYVSRYDSTAEEPIVTSFNSGSDNELWLYIGDSFIRYRELNADTATTDEIVQEGQVGYVYTEGDRVRIFTDSNGDWLTDFIDLPIKGQRGDAIIVDVDGRLPEMIGGEFIEIMTPTPEVEARLYKEIPGAIVEILNPTTAPTWASMGGTLPGGDTYYLATKVPARPGYVPNLTPPSSIPWRNLNVVRESQAISDFYPSTYWHQGRPNIEDDGADQEYRPTLVRYSQPYIPQTTDTGTAIINQLNLFYPLGIKEANRNFGLIQKMEIIGGVILCICTNQTSFSIYVGLEQTNVSGDTFVTDRVLSQVRKLKENFGTLNPESVVKDRGYVKWVDRASGVIVRYGPNGLDKLSDMYHVGSFVRNKSKRLEEFNTVKIPAGLDQLHDEYIATFLNPGGLAESSETAESIIYFEKEKTFSSFLDWFPEQWGRTDLGLFSFKEGRFYQHNVSNTYNNFGGVQFPMSITISLVRNPDTELFWKALWIRANGGGWSVPVISNETQVSNLIEDDFDFRENVWRAAFYRDENTPNVAIPLIEGDVLRDSYLVCELQYNGSELRLLYSVIGLKDRSEPTYP
jgi:hypothetical protein